MPRFQLATSLAGFACHKLVMDAELRDKGHDPGWQTIHGEAYTLHVAHCGHCEAAASLNTVTGRVEYDAYLAQECSGQPD